MNIQHEFRPVVDLRRILGNIARGIMKGVFFLISMGCLAGVLVLELETTGFADLLFLLLLGGFLGFGYLFLRTPPDRDW